MIFLATPIWRYFDIRTSVSVVNTLLQNRERIRWEVSEGSALISRVRSRMATIMLDTDCEILVFVDDDVNFAPDDFWKIVIGAREKKSIYGGVYPLRSAKINLAVRPADIEIKQDDRRDPIEVEYISGGFVAIHRDVLEDVCHGTFIGVDGEHTVHLCDQVTEQPFYNLFAPFVVQRGEFTEYLSEDWAFCERARQLGYKVWADRSIWLGHRGLVTMTYNDVIVRDFCKSDKAPPSGMSFATDY